MKSFSKSPNLSLMTTFLLLISLCFVACEKEGTTDNTAVTDSLQETITTARDCEEELIADDLCFAQKAENGEEGYTKCFFEGSDQVQSIGHFSQGQQEGFWQLYYENGEPRWEGHFSRGKRDGFWKDYYDTGRVQEEGHYVSCLREGFWKFYHPTGQVESEGYYQDAIRVGGWKFYDEKGKLIEEAYFDCY